MAIQYNINDQKTPIVIIVGPASSGKSMVLVRIAKYLNDNGFTVKADRSYINTEKYQRDCDEFEKHLTLSAGEGGGMAMPGSVTDLLVEVRDEKKNKICQFLEAPGEDYFSASHPDRDVPPYLQTICGGGVHNRKCFVLLLDLDSCPEDDKGVPQLQFRFRNNKDIRNLYIERITGKILKNIRRKKDRFILLYNKVDIPGFGTTTECSNEDGAKEEAQALYGRLFKSDKLQRKWLGFFTLPNFSFLPFCTGSYSAQKDDEGKMIKQYNPSDDIYPQRLWAEIVRRF